MTAGGRPLVIGNPAAGGGRGRDRWRANAPLVAERIGRFDLAWTGAPGDAERIARSEGASRPLLVAFGGDGTASEVACGLAQSGGAAELGLLPCGTGNDFAGDVGIPSRLPEAVRLLGRLPGRPTDLGRVECEEEGLARHFLNSLSLGLAASVAARAAKDARGLGRATYAAAAVREFLGFGPRTLRCRLDDGAERPRVLLNFTVLNSRRFGAGIRLAPPADPGDGRLDAVLVGPLGPLALLDAVVRLLRGAHFGRPEIEHRQIRRATIRPLLAADGVSARATMEIDGEVVRYRGALTISVAPGAISVRRAPGPPASAPFRPA